MTTTENIVGSANPRAIVTVVGLLGLRPDKPGVKQTEIREDGSVIWRLNGGVTVEMWIEEGEFVKWHMDRDDDDPRAAL